MAGIENTNLESQSAPLSPEEVNGIQWCALDDAELERQAEEIDRSVRRLRDAQRVSQEVLAYEISL